MKLSIQAIFLNPFVTDTSSNIIHFSYKEDSMVLSVEETKLLSEQIEKQDDYLETIKKNLIDEFLIESSIYKKNQYQYLNFHINIYDNFLLILNIIKNVDIIKIEILDHPFFTITSNNSKNFTYARVMRLYNTPYLNEKIIYPNNLFEDVNCQINKDILSIDFSYFLDFPANQLLIKGTEQELSSIFEFLCNRSSISIDDIQRFYPFIFHKGNNSQFITLALLSKLHKYSDKDYNSLQPSIDKLYMLQDLKNSSSNKPKIIKF